jgi:hypothetical protein
MSRLARLFPLLLAAAACSSDLPETEAAPAPAAPVAGQAAAPADGDTLAGDAAGDVASDAPAPDTAARATDAPPADTGAVNVPKPAGRSTRDSIALVRAIRAGAAKSWPTGPTALAGAVLPQKRIIAYYGNPLSKRMGVLGEYETDEMLRRLDREVERWRRADPATPVQPALHLVAVTAQGAPGRDGKYRLRMSDSLIAKVHRWAESRDALLFLDVQTGWSTIQEELPRLLPWLERPNVHFGMDPEFNMHYDREGVKPGAKIGVYDARDVNYVVRTLSDLVARKKLPPKVLVVHRFTKRMVTNAGAIRPDPRVQVVMHMDGWGPPWLKYDSYKDYVIAEPVQYTGFKIFYHNDSKKGDPIVTPAELVRLRPAPLYIQYQ